MNSFGEKILFSRLKSKDKEAFIKAYDLYINSIYRFIYFKVNDEDEAWDLTSAVFLKAWNHIQNNNLLDYKTLRSLFYKIARNSVIDYYREQATQKNNAVIGAGRDGDNIREAMEKIADEKQDIERRVGVTLDLAMVEKKLLDLKDEYREIIILRFTEELSISEIAEILGKSNGNIRILVHRALKALRELVNK